VVSKGGTKHDFPSAAAAFARAFPWLAATIATPGVASVPMPGAPPHS
jgi:hypothetical protein